SRPDGYSVLVIAASVAVNPSIRKSLPYDSIRDLQPVAQVATLPFVLVVNPKLQVRTLPELVSHSKKQPNGLNAAVAGTANRIVTELFRLQTGANLVLIPYKGCGPATLSVVAGETDLTFCSAPSLSQFVLDGRLVALAVTGDRRLSMLPNVPTTKELGVPGTHIDLSQWVGVFVRTGTPAPIAARLNAAINEALALPDVASKINALGGVPTQSTIGEFNQFFLAEIEKYREIVKRAGIPID
ncbi:MAG: tripartite tricarboxylate transporter substrate-binding protein, partial [Thermomicrobiales bacterium]